MQTVFRKEFQDDPFYSEWLKRQEETFEDFAPENVPVNSGINVNISGSANITAGRDIAIAEEDLETMRIKSYEDKTGLFLVHTWRPSFTPDQVADIVIWLQQHGEGPLSNGNVEKVEYQLGPKFFDAPVVKRNAGDKYKLEISAFGPALCIARVYFKNDGDPIELERYLDFEEAP